MDTEAANCFIILEDSSSFSSNRLESLLPSVYPSLPTISQIGYTYHKQGHEKVIFFDRYLE